jgi:hypothetical protein
VTPESERILDAAIEYTFPASDPLAVQTAFQAACERELSGEPKEKVNESIG